MEASLLWQARERIRAIKSKMSFRYSNNALLYGVCTQK